jgi:small subunit ribosomal protein S14
MARKSIIERNKKRQKTALIHRDKRQKLKDIANDNSLSFQERLNAQIKLSELPKDGSRIRYKNRCAITGRARGNLRKFGMSRIAVRELASWGQIPGLIKSSW